VASVQIVNAFGRLGMLGVDGQLIDHLDALNHEHVMFVRVYHTADIGCKFVRFRLYVARFQRAGEGARKSAGCS